MNLDCSFLNWMDSHPCPKIYEAACQWAEGALLKGFTSFTWDDHDGPSTVAHVRHIEHVISTISRASKSLIPETALWAGVVHLLLKSLAAKGRES
jgi:hypothetical protein